MINVKKNVPELRFPGFNDEWEEKKLGNICKIKKGQQLSKISLNNFDKYPVINGGIRPSGYIDKYNKNENSIVISEGGASCGYVNFIKTKFWSGGHCYTLEELKNIIIVEFLYQYLKFNEKRLSNLRVGSGLPNIQQKAISSFEIMSPSLAEQQKIAAFLSAIDKKIEIVDKKIEYLESYKKGLMQKLLTGKIRFPGFNDEWKEEKLGNLIAEINKNKIENQQQYEVANIKLYGKGLKHTEKTPNITKKGRPYFIINYGDILIGKQAFHCGSVAIATKDFENCVTSNAILHMIENKKKCNKKFIFYYLTNECFYNKLKMLSEGTGQKEISKTEFNNIRINIPSLPEQQKIASFLTLIDKKIELVTKKLENLKAYKKGLLQKMFV